MGGAGTGESFRANVRSLAHLRLLPSLLREPQEPDTACELFGFSLSMPVLAAPMTGASFNLAGAMSEQDFVAALLDGAEAAGTVGCTGDGGLDESWSAARDALGQRPGRVIPFFKPWADAELTVKLDAAEALGVSILGLDLEGIGFTILNEIGRPVISRRPEELREILARHPFRVILKGVMTPDEGEAAVEAGAAAVLVSNHGGRVLDHTPGVAEVLPAVARAVRRASGRKQSGRVLVLADGGVRSGADVLAMLALGADAVMVGRPLALAAVGGGADAVAAWLRQCRWELAQAMVLTGRPDLGSISSLILK